MSEEWFDPMKLNLIKPEESWEGQFTEFGTEYTGSMDIESLYKKKQKAEEIQNLLTSIGQSKGTGKTKAAINSAYARAGHTNCRAQATGKGDMEPDFGAFDGDCEHCGDGVSLSSEGSIEGTDGELYCDINCHNEAINQ